MGRFFNTDPSFFCTNTIGDAHGLLDGFIMSFFNRSWRASLLCAQGVSVELAVELGLYLIVYLC